MQDFHDFILCINARCFVVALPDGMPRAFMVGEPGAPGQDDFGAAESGDYR